MDPSPRGQTLQRTRAGIFGFFNRQSPKGERHEVKGPVGLTTIAQPEGNAIVDLIFVHGLNGGSFSTWTHGGNLALFWPRAWLPRDEEFRDARIHTFGYNSSWSHPSVLDIEDFAMALLGAVKDCPHMRKGDGEQEVPARHIGLMKKVYHDTDSPKLPPLILVGHSMGGLVIKRAYALARSMDAFQDIGEQIISIFFLATPHRGADVAQLLTRIHGITGIGPLPFVEELHKDSATIRSINDEFPNLCCKLQLFSFFETRPIMYGVRKGLIVEKECAVMGHENERRVYLDANHRTVARFSSKADSAYRTIRHALATVIYLLRSHPGLFRQLLTEERHRALDSFLQVSDAPVGILGSYNNQRYEGTCEWFFQAESFRQWRMEPETRIYYLTGIAGSGKSVLTSYIINQMRRNEVNRLARDCCYFFFRSMDEYSCTTEGFLRSVVWQMASLHPPIHAMVMDIARKFTSTHFTSDVRAMFSRIFTNGILKINLNKLQYWILDGVDECNRPQDLFYFLHLIQESWPVYVFISSRPSINKALQSYGLNIIQHNMESQDV